MISSVSEYENYLDTVGTDEGPHCLAFHGANGTLIPSFVFSLREQITEEKKVLNNLNLMPLDPKTMMVTYDIDSFELFFMSEDEDDDEWEDIFD